MLNNVLYYALTIAVVRIVVKVVSRDGATRTGTKFCYHFIVLAKSSEH
jgi:hypothetical protein